MDNYPNKTILKNAVYLYLRTIFSIVIALYTSRIFLEYLGVEDFGIYNLVGGVVTLFSVLQNLLAGATQRFLNVEIGRGNHNRKGKILNISITIHIILALFVVLVGETIGLCFLIKYLNVPEGKDSTALIVYHVSVITVALSLLRTPYSALIIAYEKMSFFAYISIIEIFGRLLITISLHLFENRLIIYSLLLLTLTVVIVNSHILYCKIYISLPQYVYYKFKKNKEYIDLLSFSGWAILGNGASVARDQGISFLLNIFYGVVLNAAMGVINQISNVYSTLFGNIQMAFMPQITQNSEVDRVRYSDLVLKCCIYSFVLMGLVCLPMIAFSNQILHLWLGNNVPEYTSIFVQIIMVKVLIVSISQSVYQSLVAIVKIKQIQIWFVVLSITSIITSYFLLKMDFDPVFAISTIPVMDLLVLICRLYYMRKFTSISITDLFAKLIKPIIFIFVCGVPIAFYASTKVEGIANIIIMIVIYIIIYVIFALYGVLSLDERGKLYFLVKKRLKY